jgi:hypothetical protein
MPSSCGAPSVNNVPPLVNGNCYQGISITGNQAIPGGVYYVSGDGLTMRSAQFAISGNGNVTGTDVTIVLFKGADVSIMGTPTVTLSAPTSGTWKGILFWQDKTSTPMCPTSTCSTIAGTVNAVLTGALYFPKDNFSFAGTSSSTCTVLIANTISFQGTPKMSASSCAAAGVTPPTTSGPIVLLE